MTQNPPLYAVIYDVPYGDDLETCDEQYYGFFSSPQEAAEIYGDAFANSDAINAKLVLVVGDMQELFPTNPEETNQ